MVFTPAPQPRANGRHAAVEPEKTPVVLHEEPEDAVLLLGEMYRDANVILDKLKTLPFAGPDGYRGDLRVILGAAKRTGERCTSPVRTMTARQLLKWAENLGGTKALKVKGARV